MANTIRRDKIGGEGIHVRDCYVWAEISYLDSPSDFREYLLQDRHWKPNDDRLLMLDSPRRSVIGDALAGLVVVAITILTIGFVYTLVVI
jgi:hypothetical protein